MCNFDQTLVVGLIPLGSASPVELLIQGYVICADGYSPQSVSIRTSFTQPSSIVVALAPTADPQTGTFEVKLTITSAIACGDVIVNEIQPLRPWLQMDATCVSPTPGAPPDTCSWRPFAPPGIPLECDTPCPEVTAGQVGVGPCINAPGLPADGAQLVGFALFFDPPLGPNAIGTIVLNFGGADYLGNTSYTYSFPNPSPSPGQQFTYETAFKHLPSPYAMSATVNVINESQNSLCSSTIEFSSSPPGNPPGVVIGACLPCPTEVQVDISKPASGWCVPKVGPAIGVATFTATVVWPTGTTSPPLATFYDWTVKLPDGSQAKRTNVAAAPNGTSQVSTQGSATLPWTGNVLRDGSINLSQVGTYAVSAVAKFPANAGLPTNPDGTPFCDLTGGGTFDLPSCAICPSITISVAMADCADPGSGKPANIGFQANLSDPSGIATSIDWNFGDGHTANKPITDPTALNPSNAYVMPGNYPVTAKVEHPAPCDDSQGGSDTASLALTVIQCPGGPPPGGGNWGCFIGHSFIAILFGAAIGALFIGLCLASHFAPPLSGAILKAALIIAGVLLSLGIVTLTAWLILVALGICPGVCAWGLLLIGESLIVAGWTMIVLYSCCPSLWFGLVGIVVGFLLLLLWRSRCKVAWCDFWAEILAMLVGSALSIINAVAQLPLKDVANCQLSTSLVAVLTGLIAILSIVVGNCKSKSGGGAPP